jgi:hypothetical protein
MLEFKKSILMKVSFDLELFEKELRKAIRRLRMDELVQLKSWCLDTFKGAHRAISAERFNEVGL